MKKNKREREQWDEIEIAFDRRNKLYIAYSTETGIVGSGVCVPDAIEKYKENYFNRREIPYIA